LKSILNKITELTDSTPWQSPSSIKNYLYLRLYFALKKIPDLFCSSHFNPT